MSWSFANWFLSNFPSVILVLCVMYFFEVYSKAMKYLGLDEYTYYDFYDPDQLENGIVVLNIERAMMARVKSGSSLRGTGSSNYSVKDAFITFSQRKVQQSRTI